MVQQWEYKYDTSMKTEYLNELGEQGWQLCAWTPGQMIFKRPLDTEADWIKTIRNYCRENSIAPTTLITAYEELKKATS